MVNAQERKWSGNLGAIRRPHCDAVGGTLKKCVNSQAV